MSNEQRSPTEEHAARSGRSLFLFVFLLIVIVVYPYAGDHGLRYDLFRSLALFVTVASVYAVSFRRSTWVVALTFAIPVAWHRFLVLETGTSKLALVGVVISFAFDVFIVAVLIRRILWTEVITSATIFEAVSIYLLIGFAFTRLYLIVSTLHPGSFYLDPVLNDHLRPTAYDLIYYSFGTMTSLGSAGISPVTEQARSLTIIEAILGILYLGVLVSRLVAAYAPQMARRASRESSPTDQSPS